MRNTGIALLALMLILGIAGAHMVRSSQADADGFCYGYEICR